MEATRVRIPLGMRIPAGPSSSGTDYDLFAVVQTNPTLLPDFTAPRPEASPSQSSSKSTSCGVAPTQATFLA